jgi:hypothetical protein
MRRKKAPKRRVCFDGGTWREEPTDRKSKYRCGKVFYPTRERAMKVAGRRQHEDAGYLRAYHCPECGGWHLTSKPKR